MSEAGAKRQRRAVQRDDDYVFDDDEEYKEEKVKPERKRPAAAPDVPKRRAAPAPVIKLTVTQPLQQLTKEEQRLLDKYAKLRALQLERRKGTDAASTAPAGATEEATKRAMAALSQQLEHEREGDGESRQKNRPSRRLAPAAAAAPPAKATASGVSKASPTYADADDMDDELN